MIEDLRKWEAAHPERMREVQAAWQRQRYNADIERGREIGKQNMRKRRAETPEKVTAEFKSFREKNPNYFREWRRERTRKLEAQGLCIVCGIEPNSGRCKSCEHCRKSANARCLVANRQIRTAVLALYGGACACCGETEDHFLSLDHVNNNGGKLRRSGDSNHVSGFYRYALKEKRDDLQLLCHNWQLCQGTLWYLST